MKIQVITVATHVEGTFNNIVNNNHGIKVKVLGMNQKWTGFRMKNQLTYNYIKDLDDQDIIIFIDGFDSMINGTLNDAIIRFKKFNTRVLISQENKDFIYPIKKYVFSTCKNNIVANSGLYMGYVKELKILLSDALTSSCNDDQVTINTLCKKYDFIMLDENNEIFKNISIINDENNDAIFCQTPGKITFNRIYRGIFEYGQFIINYILIASILLFILLYKKNYYKGMLLLCILLSMYFQHVDFSCY